MATFVLLIAQYLLGLLTNAYAPSAGFNAGMTDPLLNWHWTVGFVLGIVSILSIALAAITRSRWLVLPAVLVFASVLIAGLAGSAFTDTAGNPPQFSVLMGASFLFAFISQVAYARLWMMGRPRGSRPPSPIPPTTPAQA
ncbi:MAG: hypothetical protein L3K16_05355 [Thermoplasmata archaeon]|nr:hypothetical protein [Thermoplasmata archaeon]